MPYKITVEKLTEYDETVQMWRDPQDPEKMEASKYDFDSEVRERLVSHQRPTGKKRMDSTKILEQTVEDLTLENVIKAVNHIQ